MQATAIRFDLLRTLLAFIETVPKDQVNMNVVFSKTQCGSIGCAIGWAATMREFRVLGLEWSECGWLSFRGKRVVLDDAAAKIFDLPFDEDAMFLFGPTTHHESRHIDHKSVFRERCRVFFGKHGQVL